MNNVQKIIQSSRGFYLPTWKIKIAPPCTSPNLGQNLLSDRLWVPLL